MSYEKTVWSNGDTITAEKLNNIEDGIEAASAEAPLIENREVIIPQTILNKDDKVGGPTSACYYMETVTIPGTAEDFFGRLVPFDTYIVTIDGHEHYCIYDGGLAFCEPGLLVFMSPSDTSVGVRADISAENPGEEGFELRFEVIFPRTGSTVTAKLEHAAVTLPAGLQPTRIFSGSADTQPK
jgi:hypothetical protein